MKLPTLRVAVFDLSACTGYVAHAECAEIVVFGKRCAFVIALLVCGREAVGIFVDNVILKFTHGLESQTCGFGEFLASFVQRMFGRRFERLAVLVAEAAQHGYGGNIGKGIEESGAVAGNYIEVAAAGTDEREK